MMRSSEITGGVRGDKLPVPAKNADQLAMPRPSELINKLQRAEAVTAILQDFDIPGKGRGGAGNIENIRDIRLRQAVALLLSARARRVEDDGFIGAEFAARDGFLK